MLQKTDAVRHNCNKQHDSITLYYQQLCVHISFNGLFIVALFNCYHLNRYSNVYWTTQGYANSRTFMCLKVAITTCRYRLGRAVF